MLFGDYYDLKALHKHIATLSKAKNFIGVNLERKLLLLKWLYLFGYSDRKTILMLIDCSDRGGYRFITELTKQGYIQTFENPFYNNDLFMLDKKGMGLLVEGGFASLNETAHNKRKFVRTKRVAHENGLHQLILMFIRRYDFDVTAIHREVKHKTLMIDAVFDAVLNTGEERKIAVEFERTEKSRRRIEYMLVEHMKNMKNKHYHYVFIGFTDKTLYDYFAKIMIDQPKEWDKHEKTKRLFSSKEYKEQYGSHNFHFVLIENDEIAEETNLSAIRDDKSHRLHPYLTANKRQKVDQKTTKEIEQEQLLREKLKEELRTKIEDELREEQEARRHTREKYLITSTKDKHTKKVLAFLQYKYKRRGLLSVKDFTKYFDYLTLKDDEDFKKYLNGDLELK